MCLYPSCPLFDAFRQYSSEDRDSLALLVEAGLICASKDGVYDHVPVPLPEPSVPKALPMGNAPVDDPAPVDVDKPPAVDNQPARYKVPVFKDPCARHLLEEAEQQVPLIVSFPFICERVTLCRHAVSGHSSLLICRCHRSGCSLSQAEAVAQGCRTTHFPFCCSYIVHFSRG